MTIRFARHKDLPQIVEIINQATRSGTANAFRKALNVADKTAWLEAHQDDSYPVYVLESEEKVIGWASLSPYRDGRLALRKVAEISYYIDYAHHRKGLGNRLMTHAISDCERLGFKHLIAIFLEINIASTSLLEKFGFTRWAYLPDIVELDGQSCSHLIYGRHI